MAYMTCPKLHGCPQLGIELGSLSTDQSYGGLSAEWEEQGKATVDLQAEPSSSYSVILIPKENLLNLSINNEADMKSYLYQFMEA